MWHTTDGMGWWMVFGMVIWILFWGSVIYLFFYAITQRGRAHDDSNEPLDVARRRLARGDISAAEFEEIARHLR